MYKNERRITNPKSFVFPKFIEIDEEFAEAIGIYCGDGKTTSNDMRHTELGTKDEDIGVFMLNFFRNRLNIRNKDITFEILFKEGNEYVFQKIIELSLQKLKWLPDLRRAFLRGYFAADGSLKPRRYSKLTIGEITFNYNKYKENWLRNNLIDCLKLEGIIT